MELIATANGRTGPVRKWLLKFLAALSLPALVATGFLSAQSFYQVDDLSAQWASLEGMDAAFYRTFIIASRGRVDCFFTSYQHPIADGFDGFFTSDLPWQHSFSFRSVSSNGVNVDYLDPGTRFGFYFNPGRKPYTYSEFGRGLEGLSNNYTTAVFPLWLPILFLAAAPFAWLIGLLWPRFWRRPGFCVGCGYDLRASTVRCPECGRLIAIDATAPRKTSWRRRSPIVAAAAVIIACLVSLFACGRVIGVRQEVITRQFTVNREFWNAVRYDNVDAARAAVVSGADIDLRGSPGQWALFYAVSQKHPISLIQYLLEVGPRPDFIYPGYNFGPLDFAVRDGRADAVELLLKAGANPNGAKRDDSSPLRVAICDETVPDRDHIACLLISHGADVKHGLGFGGNPVFSAVVCHCHSETLKALIDHGADWEGDDRGANLLSIAFESNNYEAAQILLDLGADSSRVDATNLQKLKRP